MDLSVIVLALPAIVHSAAAAVTLMEQILTGCRASLREAWSASRSGRKVVVTQTRSVLWTALLLVLAGSARAQSSARSRRNVLAAGEVPEQRREYLVADDRAKYTVAFGVDGSASVVKAWKIVGEELELFDTDGHLVARLEAVRTK